MSDLRLLERPCHLCGIRKQCLKSSSLASCDHFWCSSCLLSQFNVVLQDVINMKRNWNCAACNGICSCNVCLNDPSRLIKLRGSSNSSPSLDADRRVSAGSLISNSPHFSSSAASTSHFSLVPFSTQSSIGRTNSPQLASSLLPGGRRPISPAPPLDSMSRNRTFSLGTGSTPMFAPSATPPTIPAMPGSVSSGLSSSAPNPFAQISSSLGRRSQTGPHVGPSPSLGALPLPYGFDSDQLMNFGGSNVAHTGVTASMAAAAASAAVAAMFSHGSGFTPMGTAPLASPSTVMPSSHSSAPLLSLTSPALRGGTDSSRHSSDLSFRNPLAVPGSGTGLRESPPTGLHGSPALGAHSSVGIPYLHLSANVHSSSVPEFTPAAAPVPKSATKTKLSRKEEAVAKARARARAEAEAFADRSLFMTGGDSRDDDTYHDFPESSSKSQVKRSSTKPKKGRSLLSLDDAPIISGSVRFGSGLPLGSADANMPTFASKSKSNRTMTKSAARRADAQRVRRELREKLQAEQQLLKEKRAARRASSQSKQMVPAKDIQLEAEYDQWKEQQAPHLSVIPTASMSASKTSSSDPHLPRSLWEFGSGMFRSSLLIDELRKPSSSEEKELLEQAARDTAKVMNGETVDLGVVMKFEHVESENKNRVKTEPDRTLVVSQQHSCRTVKNVFPGLYLFLDCVEFPFKGSHQTGANRTTPIGSAVTGGNALILLMSADFRVLLFHIPVAVRDRTFSPNVYKPGSVLWIKGNVNWLEDRVVRVGKYPMASVSSQPADSLNPMLGNNQAAYYMQMQQVQAAANIHAQGMVSAFTQRVQPPTTPAEQQQLAVQCQAVYMQAFQAYMFQFQQHQQQQLMAFQLQQQQQQAQAQAHRQSSQPISDPAPLTISDSTAASGAAAAAATTEQTKVSEPTNTESVSKEDSPIPVACNSRVTAVLQQIAGVFAGYELSTSHIYLVGSSGRHLMATKIASSGEVVDSSSQQLFVPIASLPPQILDVLVPELDALEQPRAAVSVASTVSAPVVENIATADSGKSAAATDVFAKPAPRLPTTSAGQSPETSSGPCISVNVSIAQQQIASDSPVATASTSRSYGSLSSSTLHSNGLGSVLAQSEHEIAAARTVSSSGEGSSDGQLASTHTSPVKPSSVSTPSTVMSVLRSRQTPKPATGTVADATSKSTVDDFPSAPVAVASEAAPVASSLTSSSCPSSSLITEAPSKPSVELSAPASVKSLSPVFASVTNQDSSLNLSGNLHPSPAMVALASQLHASPALRSLVHASPSLQSMFSQLPSHLPNLASPGTSASGAGGNSAVGPSGSGGIRWFDTSPEVEMAMQMVSMEIAQSGEFSRMLSQSTSSALPSGANSSDQLTLARALVDRAAAGVSGDSGARSSMASTLLLPLATPHQSMPTPLQSLDRSHSNSDLLDLDLGMGRGVGVFSNRGDVTDHDMVLAHMSGGMMDMSHRMIGSVPSPGLAPFPHPASVTFENSAHENSGSHAENELARVVAATPMSKQSSRSNTPARSSSRKAAAASVENSHDGRSTSHSADMPPALERVPEEREDFDAPKASPQVVQPVIRFGFNNSAATLSLQRPLSASVFVYRAMSIAVPSETLLPVVRPEKFGGVTLLENASRLSRNFRRFIESEATRFGGIIPEHDENVRSVKQAPRESSDKLSRMTAQHSSAQKSQSDTESQASDDGADEDDDDDDDDDDDVVDKDDEDDDDDDMSEQGDEDETEGAEAEAEQADDDETGDRSSDEEVSDVEEEPAAVVPPKKRAIAMTHSAPASIQQSAPSSKKRRVEASDAPAEVWVVCEAPTCHKWRSVSSASKLGSDAFYCGRRRSPDDRFCSVVDDWIHRCVGPDMAERLARIGLATVELLGENSPLTALQRSRINQKLVELGLRYDNVSGALIFVRK